MAMDFIFTKMKGFQKIGLLLLLLFAMTICEAQVKKKSVPDTTQIKNTITGFFKWYSGNWQKVTAFKLYKGQKQKDQPPYVTDWKEAERYFAFLRKSAPQLSEEFIENERQRFKDSEAEFKKHPEDELPAGFDYDHFTNSQEEPSWFWNQLKKPFNEWKVVELNKTSALVFVTDAEGWSICLSVKKGKGKWRLADTNCSGNEPPQSQEILKDTDN